MTSRSASRLASSQGNSPQDEKPPAEMGKDAKEGEETELSDDFYLDSIKELGNDGIDAVSDLDEKLSPEERAKRKEKALQNEKKDQDQDQESAAQDAEASSKKGEETASVFKREKSHQLELKSLGFRSPKGVLLAKAFYFKGDLYALVKDGSLQSKLYVLDPKTFRLKLLEKSLPFNAADVKVLVFQDRVNVLEKGEGSLRNLYTREDFAKPWAKDSVQFDLGENDASSNASKDKDAKKENLLDFDFEKSFVVVYEDKVFFFSDKGSVFFSADMKKFHLLVKEAPWLAGDLYYPIVFQNKLYVFGTQGSGSLTGFVSRDGLVWRGLEKEPGKLFPLRPGFRLVAFKDRLYALGGRDAALLPKQERNFTLFEDGVEKQGKLLEQEEIKKQLEEQQKLLDLKKTDKEKEEEKKVAEDRKKSQEGFVFSDSKEPQDLRPDLVDEKLYRGTSKEIKRPFKKMNRLDENDLELEDFGKDSLEGFGLFSSSDGVEWKHEGESYSRSYNAETLVFDGKILSLGYRGLLTDEYVYDPRESSDALHWREKNAGKDEDEGSLVKQKGAEDVLYRSLGEDIYVLEKKEDAYFINEIGEDGEKKGKAKEIALDLVNWIGEAFEGKLFMGKDGSLFLYDPKEDFTAEKRMEIPFDLKDLETFTASKDTAYFFVGETDGQNAVYAYRNGQMLKAGAFQEKIRGFSAASLSGELFVFGGENQSGEPLNEIWKSKDLVDWQKVPDFELQKVSSPEEKKTDPPLSEARQEGVEVIDEAAQEEGRPKEKKIFLERFSPRTRSKTFFFKGELYLAGGFYKDMTMTDVWKTKDAQRWIYVGSFSQGDLLSPFEVDKLLIAREKMFVFDGFDGNVYGAFEASFLEKPGLSLGVYGEDENKGKEGQK